ncbi:MAG: DUF2059 domain-containing protein [Pseudomonadales bacterium]
MPRNLTAQARLQLYMARQRVRLIVALGAICLGICPVSSAAESAPDATEKLALIKELVQVTGAASNSEQYSRAFSQQLVSVLRISNPDLSDKAVRIVEEEVNKTINEAFSSESLQKQIYPIYAKYFTVEELKGLIAFNQSPAGQKANRVMPQLIAESNAAAQIWARTLSPQISGQVLRRLKDEGIDIKLVPAPQN